MQEIIIAVRNKDGVIDSDSIQSFNEWSKGSKNSKILINKSGNQLFKILQEDLNYVQLNEAGVFQLRYLVSSNIEESAMRIMGNIAEAIIVSNCEKSKKLNREYASIARKGKKVVKTPDKYIAIATGHYKTKMKYKSKYNPNHTQNDIIWIKRDDPEKELMQIGSNAIHGKVAALQVKASNQNSDYIYKEIRDNKYKVPIIYFGMRENHYKISKKLEAYDSKIDIDNKFINIRDIDEDAYDEFLEYKSLVKKLLEGKLKPIDLITSEDLILNAAAQKTAASFIEKKPILLLPN